MTRTAADWGQISRLLDQVTETAVKVERQPLYLADDMAAMGRWRNGDHTPPVDTPEFAAWVAQIRASVSAGVTWQRIRVIDDPPTAYQEWGRWCSQWNVDAGEQIAYTSTDPGAPGGVDADADWWLLDRTALVVMRFDAGILTGSTIDDDPSTIEEAAAWFDSRWGRLHSPALA